MIIGIVIFATGFLLSKGSVLLSPSPALAADGESFTFTCTYNGSEKVNGFTWRLDEITLAVILMPACTPFANPGPPDSTRYNYTCPSVKKSTFTVKQISYMNNGNNWQCIVAAPGYIFSNNVTIIVQVSVSRVSLTPTTGSIIENIETTFKCLTSASRPAANITWYKEITDGQAQKITSKISTETEITNDLEVSKSVLKYTPFRNVSGYEIYCEASNIPGKKVTSTKFRMDVHYSPDGPPKIQLNGSIYKVIDNTKGLLKCEIKGGNPLANLTWTCFNKRPNSVTSGTTVMNTVQWDALQGPDRSCTCKSWHPVAGSQSVNVTVSVLYKPDSPSFSVNSMRVSGPVNFINGKSRSVVCESNGKPNPDMYSWQKADGSIRTGNTLTLNPVQKKDNGQYTCTASNTMMPSRGEPQIGSNSSTVKINVLFAPSTPTIHYGTVNGQVVPGNTIAAIKDSLLTVVCKSNGNPKPTYTWTGHTVGKASLTVKMNVIKQIKTCIGTNTMIETHGVTKQGSSTTLVTFSMLYSPEIKDCKLQYEIGSTITVPSKIKIKENSSFTLTCSVDGNPTPSTSWFGHTTSSSKTLVVNNVKKQHNGTYTLFATNRMEPSFGDTKIGNSSKSFIFNILYPPRIGEMVDKDIVAGTDLSFHCPITEGNPSLTTSKWTRDDNSRTWNSQILDIQNVTKNDDMIYTCAVQNIMTPTGSSMEFGTDSASFHLNVLYKASVTSFTVRGSQNTLPSSVTVDESANVPPFKCDVDSNPGSSIKIQFLDKTLNEKENVKTLTYNHTKASCLDTGVYTCSAMNQYNLGKASERIFNLFVRCSPRPLLPVEENVTSALRVQTVFNFKALAYPTPKFTWMRKHGNEMKPLSNNSNITISVLKEDTNLTIKNVSQSDYGEYQLKIENEISHIIQHFHLIPEGVPETPTDLQVVKGHISESSVLLQWKPGFDGGPEQTFILLYKKTLDHVWKNKTVEDTTATILNYTLNNLNSNTEYQVIIFSQNRVGDSHGSTNITFMTEVAEVETTNGNSALIGAAAGGSAGVALFVVLIVGVVFLKRRGILTKGKAYGQEENSDRKPVHADEDDYGMQDNPMYVSAGPMDRGAGGSGSSDPGAVYSTVDKGRNIRDTNKNDVYAEVHKSKKKTTNKGNDKKEKNKSGSLKDKKNKKMAQEGDIYENATTTELQDTTAKQKKNYETIYENPEPSKPVSKKHVNKDGLIYADLAFNDQSKGQKKLVIHGLDSMTEYVEVDFTKKADPLPDSDDENVSPK